MCYETEKSFDNPEMWALYEDSLREKEESKRDRIISVISNFDFDRFRSSTEWINLYIDDSGYPVFEKKKNSVIVRLIYTSDSDGELRDINFNLQLFVWGKTIVTCSGPAPTLTLFIAQVIAANYLQAARPVYNNLMEKKAKKTIRFKRGIIYKPQLVTSLG